MHNDETVDGLVEPQKTAENLAKIAAIKLEDDEEQIWLALAERFGVN